MQDDNLIVLTGSDILGLLEGQEQDIMARVRAAYEAHLAGATHLPPSSFLRFPDRARERIIALPAYLGNPFEVAGIKWIASFPENRQRRMDRASAVIVLNSTQTGHPIAVLEGSVISAKRTAASAALAAHHLHSRSTVQTIGLLGCGYINFEIARFMGCLWPDIPTILLFDLQKEQAVRFAEKLSTLFSSADVHIMENSDDVFAHAEVVSLATTAVEPHINDISNVASGSTLLHISLRDLTTDVILACDNIVDDVDHVCRASTSVHLTEQRLGNRAFIRGTLAEVLRGKIVARDPSSDVLVFSPFGMGILDLALADLAYMLALQNGAGSPVARFLPPYWMDRIS